MAEPEKEQVTDPADYAVPTEFSAEQQLEEIECIYREKRDFIDTKVKKGTLKNAELGLARLRLARVAAIGATMRALVNGQSVPVKLEPELETTGDEDEMDGWR